MNQEQTPPSSKKPTRKDHRTKIVFLIVVLAVVTIIYLSQRKDPKLKGWVSSLPAAQQQAREKDTNLIVLFTRQSMTHDDKKIVKKCLNLSQTRKELGRLGYIKAHLRVEDDPDSAQRYEITRTPTLVLLDATGNVLKKHEGFLTDLDFTNNFLDGSVTEIPE